MNNSVQRKICVGDVIAFGRYPQNAVTDSKIITAVTALCGKPGDKSGKWKQFGYATGSGMYADVQYEGVKYRCIYTQKHRMDKFMYEFCDYKDKRIYVFSFEPVLWRALSIADGKALLACEKAIDAQEYYTATKKRKIDGETVYPNNYKYSFVRQWLNGVFLDTAFTEEEQSEIAVTAVNNAAATTKKPVNEYACEDTFDKVFLLSFQEAKTLFKDNKDRYKKATEYAKSQGCYAYKTKDAKYNNACWWLRSPDGKYENIVRCVGDSGEMGDGGFSCSQSQPDCVGAVVPAIHFIII